MEQERLGPLWNFSKWKDLNIICRELLRHFTLPCETVGCSSIVDAIVQTSFIQLGRRNTAGFPMIDP